MSGASRRSSSRSTTSTPPAQCASPVPETVIPTSSTLGDDRRNVRATRSSPATSVSMRSGRRAPALGIGRVVAAAADAGGEVASGDAAAGVAATSFRPAVPSSSRRRHQGDQEEGVSHATRSYDGINVARAGYPPDGTCPDAGVQTPIVVRIDLTSCTPPPYAGGRREVGTASELDDRDQAVLGIWDDAKHAPRIRHQDGGEARGLSDTHRFDRVARPGPGRRRSSPGPTKRGPRAR